jgi:hypothetical protein
MLTEQVGARQLCRTSHNNRALSLSPITRP